MSSGVIEVGQVVNIHRSDGRIHRATVVMVRRYRRLATVEWNEGADRKGKAVSFNKIWRWNAFQKSKEDEEKSSSSRTSVQKKIFTVCSLPVIDIPSNITESKSKKRRELSKSPVQRVDAFSQTNRNNYPRALKIVPAKTPQPTKRCSASLVRPQPKLSVKQRAASTARTITTSVPDKKTQTIDTAKRTRQFGNQSIDQVVQTVRKIEENRHELRRHLADIRADHEHRQSQSKHWEIIKMIDAFRSALDLKPIPLQTTNKDLKITVCIRKRPLSKKEIDRQDIDVLTVLNMDHIVAHEMKHKVDNTKYIVNQCFRFDYVFDVQCSNNFVYEHTAKPLVLKMFMGGVATCFAYGQTGSGKTHTMGGSVRCSETGIYSWVAADIFELMKVPRFIALELIVVASYYEIYLSKVYDLLERRAPLMLLEDKNGKVKIRGLSEKTVNSVDDVTKLIQRGNRSRTSAKTSVNDSSSRSHAVFQLSLQQRASRHQYGKLSLIDLAGNERGSDNKYMEKKSRMETGQINKTLLILKECIRAMGTPGMHLPFRGSKLTQVLRDSFIGEEAKTCMIGTVSPALSSCEHSIDTLHYADRVKSLQTRNLKVLSKEGSIGSSQS